MSVINVDVIDQTLTMTNMPVIASGGDNEDKVHFNFRDSLWDGYTKSCHFFFNDDETISEVALDGNGEAVIPAASMRSAGVVTFGLVGNSSGSTRTSEVVRYSVAQGAKIELSPAPTVDIYRQILQKSAQFSALADYVVSETTVDGWTVRKWNNGRCEAEKTVELSDVSFSAWNPVYAAMNKIINFPSNVFTTINDCSIELSQPVLWVGGKQISSTRVIFYVFSCTNETRTFDVRVKVAGSYK